MRPYEPMENSSLQTGKTDQLGKLCWASLVVAGIAVIGCGRYNVSREAVLFENGTYKADIVLPAAPNGVEKFAVEELAYHFGKAFGKEPEVVGEDALDSSRHQFHIYVGATKAAMEAGLPVGKLADEEHVVKTAGNGLYLLGGDGDTTYAEVMDVHEIAMRGTLYAVYDFLENEMGVKWLWPGKTGEVVPKRTSLKVGALDRRAQEPLEFRQFIFGQCRKLKTGWSNDAVAEQFFRDEERFLLRQRHGKRRAFNHGHSFGKWWNLHHEKHPEYFNLLPNGKRMPQRAPELCTICVSEPGVKMQRVADWCKWWESESKRRHPLLPWVNCCENDAAGLCVCERCRSWDGPDPRFVKSPYWNGSLAKDFDEKCMGRKFMSEVGLSDGARWVMYPTCPSDELAASLSDRYVRFYNEVATEAKKHNPDAKTIGYAYANYIEPPMKTRVGPDTVIIFVPRSYFPYDKTESDAFRKQWSGWRQMGATQMVYRPNYMLAGGNHPIDMARLILDDFAYAYTNGMFAAYHDELTGAYSAQAMFLYAMIRSLRDPLRGYEKARTDMLSGFGGAAKAVNGYFDLVERHTAKWTLDAYREIAKNNITDNYWGGSFRNPNAVLGDYFDEQFFVDGYRLLDEANAAVSGDGEVVARIDFLRKGLRDTELGRFCRIAQKASDAALSDAVKKTAYVTAFKALVAYRQSVEADCVCNYSRHAHWERQYIGWPHEVRGAKPKPKTPAGKKNPFGWNDGE